MVVLAGQGEPNVEPTAGLGSAGFLEPSLRGPRACGKRTGVCYKEVASLLVVVVVVVVAGGNTKILCNDKQDGNRGGM